MEREMFITDTDGEYPVLIIPKKCTSLETNHDATDNVYIAVNITTFDTDGNEMGIYSGFCNVKVIDDLASNEVNHTDIATYNPSMSEANYPGYTQSQVWIDPVRSPYVYNDTEEPVRHYQTHSSHITVEHHNTYITQNVYNYDGEEYRRFRKSMGECQIDSTVCENDELECGLFMTQLPEEILNEKENKSKELKYEELQNENALKQLMSSDMQSMSKQQKTILYLGNDSHYGQTIQKIAVHDPMLECADSGYDNEVVVDSTSNQKRYQCEKCNQIFHQHTSFKQHMKGNHRPAPPSPVTKMNSQTVKYMCSECGKSFKDVNKYERHCNGHGDPELECNICHKVYATKFTLKNHKKLHLRKHNCNYCKRSYDKDEDLKNHIEKMHHIYSCDSCDFKTTKYCELEDHKLNRHAPVNLMEIENALKEHISDSSTLTPPENFMEDDDKAEMIENAESVIAKVMSNKIFLAQTKRSRRYKKQKKTCDVCLKTFERIGDLKRHLIEHVIKSTLSKTPVNGSGTLNIQCEVCHGETFCKIDKYKAHLREHAKLTLYKCTFCDKSFSDSSNFSKHKKIHGSTLFHCDLCQRKFNSKKMITLHMEYHNNNAPIPCSFCEKKFHFPSTLNKHIKGIHTRELSRFRCTFCQVYYDTLKEKWDHEWKVHNVRKNIVDCVMCASKFRKYSELKRHCIDIHNYEIPPAKKFLKKRKARVS